MGSRRAVSTPPEKVNRPGEGDEDGYGDRFALDSRWPDRWQPY